MAASEEATVRRAMKADSGQSQKEVEAGAGDEDNYVEDEDDEEEKFLVTMKEVVSSPSSQACKQELDTKHAASFPLPASIVFQHYAYPTHCSF